MTKFDLVENSEVLIYGIGTLGQSIYNRIRDKYEVKGFVDRRKLSLSIKGINLPVYIIDELVELQDCVVIVCVHNATWHYEIAEKLYAKGFDKILFLPVQSTYNRDMAEDMKRAYSFLMEENFEELKDIPCYDVLKNQYTDSIIRKSGNYVVTFCRRELIFTFHEPEDKMRKEDLAEVDCPLAGFETYISLMNYFINAIGSPEKPIYLMKNLNNSFFVEDEEFLEEQWKIYQLLEREFEKGVDSFQYAPLDVVWNERGYFNILDGHHRAAFYYVKGIHNFPVRMRIECYEKWVNIDKVEDVKNELRTVIPKVPIIHPYFMEVDCLIKEYEESSLELVLKYVYKNNRKYNSVLDISDFGGEFARAFCRTGRAERIVSVADKDEYKIQQAVNALYYMSFEVLCIDDNNLENLSECFQCGVICGKYKLEDLKKARNLFDTLISDEIIWQSNKNIEEEKNYILNTTKFKKYIMLGRKCINGRIRETGVFINVTSLLSNTANNDNL